jgi:hypothetical protein
MKTRAEHAEFLCKAIDKWFSDRYGNDSVPPATVWAALNAWRSAPPDPPELKITPGPMILSPPDRLSEEEVWLRALEAATRGQWSGATNIADYALDAFREKFRKEPK